MKNCCRYWSWNNLFLCWSL